MEIGVARFGIDAGGASYPAEAIGGDYYDFIALLDGSLGVAIGDVSGHGVGPALFMAEARALLRAFAETEGDVSEIMRLVNRVLVANVDEDRFITLLLAKLDPRTRTLVYVSAGHQPGFLLSSDGVVKQPLTSTGYPLGILSDATFPASAPIALEPGDIVMLVTDGIVEARAPTAPSSVPSGPWISSASTPRRQPARSWRTSTTRSALSRRTSHSTTTSPRRSSRSTRISGRADRIAIRRRVVVLSHQPSHRSSSAVSTDLYFSDILPTGLM